MKFKFTWAHGIILAMACFIIFILSMIFRIEFSKNSFDLVEDDYYDKEIKYQKEIDASQNTMKLTEKPKVENKSYGISISFPTEFNSNNTKGKVLLYRPSAKEMDVKKELELSGINTFVIPQKVLHPGAYVLKIYWTKDKKNYQMEVPVKWN